MQAATHPALHEVVAAVLPDFKVTPTLTARGHFKHMVTVEHESVPYSLPLWDVFGNVNLERLGDALFKRDLTIQRHHALVKAVCDHLGAKGIEGVWAMCGGGCQMQVFFGNAGGYLGILYLTLEDLAEQERLTESGYLAATGHESFTLRAERAGRELKAFEGLEHPELEVVISSDFE